MLKDRYTEIDDTDENEKGSDIKWIIEETTGANEKISTDLQSYMDQKCNSSKKSPYSKNTLYAPIEYDNINSRDIWKEFNTCIEEKNDSKTTEILKSIFDASSDLPIVTADPNIAPYQLFRARVFQTSSDMIKALCNLEKHLGPPPADVAGAGRLNADGIPMFYGSEDPGTTISEVRSFVGNIVVVACFNITRRLRLLDIESLGSEMSLYDPSYESPSDREQFIFNLIKSISAPVLPGRESVDYLPTQRISDYLSNQNDLDIDGVMYKSTQSICGGNNVALFHKSSRVEGCYNMADNAVEVFTYHVGMETRVRYIVHREVSSASKSDSSICDRRNSSLQLDDSSIFIHSIAGTNFDTIAERVCVK